MAAEWNKYNMTDLSIDEAQISDLDEICEIENLSFSTPWSKDDLKSTLEHDSAAIYCARSEGKICGYMILYGTLFDCDIAKIAVCPDKRRQGIGRALMEYCFDVCAGNDLDTVFLEVRESNTAAISLYTSLGFEQINTRKDYYKAPEEDAVMMRKVLN